MTLCEFFGCALLGFGPAIAMFTLTIAQDPILIIIVFLSGFFWLNSALVSSVIWLLFDLLSLPLQVHTAISIILSVLCQESFRWLLCKTLVRMDEALRVMMESTSPVISRKVSGYAAGLGFGVMSGIFSLINVLADSVGPGTMGLKAGSEKFFLVSASLTLCFVLFHVFWSVIFFSAMAQYKHNVVQIVFVVVTHLLASTLTLLNTGGHYAAAVVPNYILLILTACVAFHAAGGTLNSLKSSLSRN